MVDGSSILHATRWNSHLSGLYVGAGVRAHVTPTWCQTPRFKWVQSENPHGPSGSDHVLSLNQTPRQPRPAASGGPVASGVVLVNIGNSLLSEEDDLGIALNFDRLLEPDALENPLLLQSTSVVYIASAEFSGLYHATKTTPKTSKGEGQKAQTLWELDERLAWRPLTDPSLKQLLSQEFFSFKKKPEDLPGEAGRFERTLLPHLPFIITSPYAPDFTAALVIMQYEFECSLL